MTIAETDFEGEEGYCLNCGNFDRLNIDKKCPGCETAIIIFDSRQE